MTPLASSLAKHLVTPKTARAPFWAQNRALLSDALSDVHFFEVTEIVPLISELRGLSEEYVSERVFLPAPKTWLEWNHQLGRIGLLVEEFGRIARVTAFFPEVAAPLGVVSLTSDDFKTHDGEVMFPNRWADAYGQEIFSATIACVHLILVIINSPRVIGRRQKMPHKGLERRLANSGLPIGKYPLHAWHELTLEARPTYFDDSGVEHEAHLTGKKCLHFCRKHIRVRNGRLEVVSAHWRGDPALGIKQTRYRVVPPKSAQ